MIPVTKIACPHSTVLVGVRFPCQLDFGHWGKCLHDLVCNDTTITWYPTQEEKSQVIRDIAEAAFKKATQESQG